MPAYGQEQLVLGAGETDGLGLLLAPPQEPTQPVAEGEQALELPIREDDLWRRHIVSR